MITQIGDRERIVQPEVLYPNVYFPFLVQNFAQFPNPQWMIDANLLSPSKMVSVDDTLELDPQTMIYTEESPSLRYDFFMPHQGQFELQPEQEVTVATVLKPKLTKKPKSNGIQKKTVASPKRKTTASPTKNKECMNCKTTETPMWRKGPNGSLCNKW